MRLIKLTIMVALLLLPVAVLAQEVPDDKSIRTEQMISQEHKNTRKFFSDEMTRQRQEYFKMIDDRAEYYEDTANDILTTAVWKLGLLWGGIVFITVGLFNTLRVKLEQRRYKKLKQTLKQEVTNDIFKEQMKSADAVQKQKEDIAKTKPELVALQTRLAQEQAKLKDLMGNYNKITGGGIG